MMNSINDKKAGDRLRELIERLYFNQKRFSKKVDISEHYLSQMINGRRGVSFEKGMQIKEVFPQVNVGWLLRGEGEMFIEEIPVQKNLAEPEAEYQRSASGSGEKMVVDATEIIRQLDALKEEAWRLGERVRYLEELSGVKKE
jgi:transcriptional regulator with XRE-family HTH domain